MHLCSPVTVVQSVDYRVKGYRQSDQSGTEMKAAEITYSDPDYRHRDYNSGKIMDQQI